MAEPPTHGLSPSAYAKAKAAWKPWEYRGPKLLMSGEPAARAVSRVLPTSGPLRVPSSLGTVDLVPGTIWGGNKMLVQVQSMSVIWTADDKLYEWGTQDFIRCEWMDAGAEGARRAEGMRRLAKIEMELLMGIFAPFQLVLGLSVAKSAVFYHANRDAIALVKQHLQPVLANDEKIKERFPSLYKKLRNTALVELLCAFPHGVTAEDIAFFVGRVIKGASAAVDALEVGQRMTISALVKIAVFFGVLVTITHSPSIFLHGGEHALRNYVKDLNAKVADLAMTEAELKRIGEEIGKAPDANSTIEEMAEALNALAPALSDLSDAYKNFND